MPRRAAGRYRRRAALRPRFPRVCLLENLAAAARCRLARHRLPRPFALHGLDLVPCRNAHFVEIGLVNAGGGAGTASGAATRGWPPPPPPPPPRGAGGGRAGPPPARPPGAAREKPVGRHSRLPLGLVDAVSRPGAHLVQRGFSGARAKPAAA